MSLFEDWKNRCDAAQSSQESLSDFWKSYFAKETEAYKIVLSEHANVIEGTVRELAEKFGMDDCEITGYIDGANQSFLSGEKELDSLSEDSVVKLDFDFEKLYYNMHECKADWLYNLTEWDDVLSVEKRNQITKQYRASKIFVRDVKIGRNDPCPCGSGKKYKNCCGKNI